jgi:hypothetical protein
MFGLAIGGASFLNILLPYAFHSRSDFMVGWWQSPSHPSIHPFIHSHIHHFLFAIFSLFSFTHQVVLVQIAQGLVQVPPFIYLLSDFAVP